MSQFGRLMLITLPLVLIGIYLAVDGLGWFPKMRKSEAATTPKTLPKVIQPSKSTTLACTGAAQPEVSKMLNVGTWNIGGDSTDAVNDQKATTVGQKFKEFNLDVLLVQEVHMFRTTSYSDPETKTNFPARVQSQVPYKLYFYSKFQREVKHSLVTISKFPIDATGYADIFGKRNITYALVNTPIGRLKVFNTHLQRKPQQMNKTLVSGVCGGMEDSVNFIASKIVTGEDAIVGGDFNAKYNSTNGYVDYDMQVRCTSTQSFTRLFDVKCSTSMCSYDQIDFVLGAKGSNPAVYQYCRKSSFGLHDAHELYVGTVKL